MSVTLFLLGGAQDASIVIRAWADTFQDGKFGSTDLTVEFLAVIGVMLRAVVMYLIGVGLYSLFVEPLNLAAALGVESLVDLETKVISVVVVILAVTFLQHFIRWEDPLATLQFGAALALVSGALVLFQGNSQQGKQFVKTHAPDEQKQAAGALFHGGPGERTIAQESKPSGTLPAGQDQAAR